MLDKIFLSITSSGLTPQSFLLCTLTSLILGLILSAVSIYKNPSTKSFAVTIAMIPFIVQVIIMLVNGNLGTGVAVAGAFSLVRFRSAPGTAKEILSIFMAMAAGLATGVGYIGIAIIFVLTLSAVSIIYTLSKFGETEPTERELKITVPENLNYTDAFDDLFKKYTSYNRLLKVKTSNLGSLYQLTYSVKLKKTAEEKQFIDEIRCRNGNLDIISCYRTAVSEEL